MGGHSSRTVRPLSRHVLSDKLLRCQGALFERLLLVDVLSEGLLRLGVLSEGLLRFGVLSEGLLRLGCMASETAASSLCYLKGVIWQVSS